MRGDGRRHALGLLLPLLGAALDVGKEERRRSGNVPCDLQRSASLGQWESLSSGKQAASRAHSTAPTHQCQLGGERRQALLQRLARVRPKSDVLGSSYVELPVRTASDILRLMRSTAQERGRATGCCSRT